MIYNFDFWLTTYCQARCRTCARTNIVDGTEEAWLVKEHMRLETFTDRLDRFTKDIGYIQFCGEMGDPCMHPQVEEFIDVSFNYANRVNLLTNGGLRSPDWFAKLGKTNEFRGPNTGVFGKFGIDGIDQESNAMYREGVNFNKAWNNMEAFFGSGGWGSWHFLIFSWNWHLIPEASLMSKEIGANICFKFNSRSHGLISEEDKPHAIELLKEFHYEM